MGAATRTDRFEELVRDVEAKMAATWLDGDDRRRAGEAMVQLAKRAAESVELVGRLLNAFRYDQQALANETAELAEEMDSKLDVLLGHVEPVAERLGWSEEDREDFDPDPNAGFDPYEDLGPPPPGAGRGRLPR